MTDRNYIYNMLQRAGQKILDSTENYIDVENPCYGELISINFDKDGNFTEIYS